MHLTRRQKPCTRRGDGAIVVDADPVGDCGRGLPHWDADVQDLCIWHEQALDDIERAWLHSLIT